MDNKLNNTDKRLISIVIPIHNEQGYLDQLLSALLREVDSAQLGDYELILVENGSTDLTLEIANRIKGENKRIRIIKIKNADYGLALREGMRSASGSCIVNFDLDYTDISFIKTCLPLLADGFDIIIASKNTPQSLDRRSILRRFISQGYRCVLSMLFCLKVSDTHGIKAWKNDERLKRLIKETKFNGHIFDSELVIRAVREGLNIQEIPASVTELRPSTMNIIKRIPEAAIDLLRLWYELNVKRG